MRTRLANKSRRDVGSINYLASRKEQGQMKATYRRSLEHHLFRKHVADRPDELPFRLVHGLRECVRMCHIGLLM